MHSSVSEDTGYEPLGAYLGEALALDVELLVLEVGHLDDAEVAWFSMAITSLAKAAPSDCA